MNPTYKLDKRIIRCSGYRHSWTDLFGDQKRKRKTVIVSMLPLYFTETCPSPKTKSDPNAFPLMKIERDKNLEAKHKLDTDKHCYVKCGGSVTNEMIRHWSNQDN